MDPGERHRRHQRSRAPESHSRSHSRRPPTSEGPRRTHSQRSQRSRTTPSRQSFHMDRKSAEMETHHASSDSRSPTSFGSRMRDKVSTIFRIRPVSDDAATWEAKDHVERANGHANGVNGNAQEAKNHDNRSDSNREIDEPTTQNDRVEPDEKEADTALPQSPPESEAGSGTVGQTEENNTILPEIEVGDSFVGNEQAAPLLAEIRRLKSELEENKVTLNKYEIANGKWDGVYKNLEREKDAVDAELENKKKELVTQATEHSNTVKEKEDQIDRLRKKITDAASKTAKLPRQYALQCPEHEIRTKWTNLGYLIQNFVSNELTATSKKRLTAWMKLDEAKRLLEEVTPGYIVAMNENNGIHFVEAVIWTALYKSVFCDLAASGSMCWAGSHAGKLSNLNASIYRGIYQSGDDIRMAMFHQWKAHTTNLFAAAVETQSSRTESIENIVEELEYILGPLRRGVFWDSIRPALEKIVQGAVALDEIMCGQVEAYFVRYPRRRSSIKLEPTQMCPVDGNTSSTEVRMVVRPGLFYRGKDGKTHASGWVEIVDRHRVLMYRS